jgi:hypothetical protein
MSWLLFDFTLEVFIALLSCKKGFIILLLLVNCVVKYERVFSCHEESVWSKTMWQFSIQLKPRFIGQCRQSIWGKQLSVNLLRTLSIVLLCWNMYTQRGCWHFLVRFHDALHSSFVQWSPFLRRWQKLYSWSLKSRVLESDWIHLHIFSPVVYDGRATLECNDFLPNYEPIQHSRVVY